MKITLRRSEYNFDAANKKIVFADKYFGLRLAQIGIITNVTANTIIYRFNSPALGATLVNLEMALAYNTTAMSNMDELQILVDIPQGDNPQLDAIANTLDNILKVNQEILERLYKLG